MFRKIEIGGIISLFIAAIGFAFWLGNLNNSISELKKKVPSLHKKIEKIKNDIHKTMDNSKGDFKNELGKNSNDLKVEIKQVYQLLEAKFEKTNLELSRSQKIIIATSLFVSIVHDKDLAKFIDIPQIENFTLNDIKEFTQKFKTSPSNNFVKWASTEKGISKKNAMELLTIAQNISDSQKKSTEDIEQLKKELEFSKNDIDKMVNSTKKYISNRNKIQTLGSKTPDAVYLNELEELSHKTKTNISHPRMWGIPYKGPNS